MIKMKTPNNIMISAKKEKKIVLYLDMDGVIDDWYTPACKLCGVDLKDKDIREKLKNGSDLSDFVGDDTVWDNIDAEGEKFWENLKLLPWAIKLYKALKATGHHIAFLSSPGKKNPIPCTPKHKYVMEHFDEDVDIVLAYNKWHCAGPNKILIDDSVKKTKAFAEEGGNIFVWPNQFQLEDDNNVDEVIDKLISKIKDME
jgi:hypothetical protein